MRKILTTVVLAVLLVGMLALALPGGSAAAQTPTPQPQKNPQAPQVRANIALERAFRATVERVREQKRSFDRANAFVKQVERLIKQAKANGKDVTALEAAVTAFKAKQAEALKLNSAAAEILKTHAGFDANKKVVNAEQAKQTLESANAKVKEAREVFTAALKKAQEAFKAWRTANPPPAQK
jgi:Spy/CpxP family protein refolding chaperone